MCDHLLLTDEERAQVYRRVLILDLTGHSGLRMAQMDGRQIVPTDLVDRLVETYLAEPVTDVPLKLVVVDPMASFSASEAAFNDNEQALIEAARSAIRQVDVCVRFIHHTGKANAREQALDQYAGRGGSAMADGSRMTAVLATWQPGMSQVPSLPRGLDANDEGSVLILARPKLSYSPPNQPLILIKRLGFGYAHEIYYPPTTEEQLQAEETEALQKFYRSVLAEYKRGARHTEKSLLAGWQLFSPQKKLIPQFVVRAIQEGLLSRDSDGVLVPRRSDNG
jgi:RecA-family ATPase